MHPLLRLVMTQPALLGAHAQGYAELLGIELATWQRAMCRRLAWAAAAAVCAAVALVLAGVALLLYATLPGLPGNALWVCVATPALPLAVALLCLLPLREAADTAAFALTREQLRADLHMLQEVGSP